MFGINFKELHQYEQIRIKCRISEEEERHFSDLYSMRLRCIKASSSKKMHKINLHVVKKIENKL